MKKFEFPKEYDRLSLSLSKPKDFFLHIFSLYKNGDGTNMYEDFFPRSDKFLQTQFFKHNFCTKGIVYPKSTFLKGHYCAKTFLHEITKRLTSFYKINITD